MSLRGKKVSAFAMFQGKKATSMSDVAAAKGKSIQKQSLKKSSSASSTPTGPYKNMTTIIGKFTNAENRKQKKEVKKVKKAMKNMGKIRPSYMPDSAMQSPLVGNIANGGNVELRSLRPKGSMTNIRYQLPLKATPDMPLNGSANDFGETPPLPPKNVGRRQNSSKSMNQGILNVSHKRSKSELTPPAPLPRVQRKGSQRSNKGDEEVLPPQPIKRRRLSQNSAAPSPSQSNTSQLSSQRSMLVSPEGARERTEPMPSHPSEKDTGVPYMFDSVIEAKRLFECLIHPVKPHKFFSELWEKKPLLVKRHMPTYNGGWLTTAEFHKILKEETLYFGKNIDVVTYVNGKRETHNPCGRAFPSVVWDHYQNGCSVRLLNPQTYSRNVWKLLSILQEFFGCMVGANVYLTPPGTQGFAPHYDDIEAFILQLEGKKHWRLYNPRTENEALARYSSSNFTEADIGEPILDVILEPGDLLYFPKGTIHQGQTLGDAHSLHITVSCQQLNSWGDLLEKLVPRALQVAIEEDIEFRKALPCDYLNHMGIAFSDLDNSKRTSFLRHVEQLMMKMLSYAPVDAACDQMGKKFIQDTLPPVLSEMELKCSVHGNGEYWNGDEMRVRGGVELDPDTSIKIIRKGVLRLVTEDDTVCIFHNLENSRVWHEKDMQCVEISADMAPAVEYLLHSYPNYTTVDNLPLDNVEEKVEVANLLYDRGLLLTATPLKALSDSESDSDDSQ